MPASSHSTLPSDSQSASVPDQDGIRTSVLKAAPASEGRMRGGGSPKLATIEGYEILSELGRGGMAIVFKARQVALNRIVALKMVLGGQFRQPEFHYRFQMEAEAVARLQHPNIIQIFDYSTVAGMFPGETVCPYIAFEYVAGGNLSTRIGGLPQPTSEAARIVEVLADAIQYAHRCGIIHRDLKPSNVMLTTDGAPKISDFGLAKLLDDGGAPADLTAAGAVLGTPEYMAPEQTLPNSRVSQAVDIYALGVILYELLTGRRPFEGSSALEVVKAVCGSEPVHPRVLQPEVPRDLETICLKCLQKTPQRRYHTARALADDLRRFRNRQPIAARPVGLLERGWKWTQRYRSLSVLVVLLMMLAFVGLPGVTLLWITADKAKQDADVKTLAAQTANKVAVANLQAALSARNEADRLRLEGALREARLAMTQGLTLCQQGQIDRGLLWLVRSLELHAPFRDAAVERDLRINLADWSQRLARPVATLDSYPRAVNAAVFVPEGAMVANDYFARHIELGSGKTLGPPIAGPAIDNVTDPFTMVLSLAVSPDEKIVALGRTNGVIQLWDIAGQKQLDPVLKHERNVWGIAFSPNGEQLAGTHDKTVVLWHRLTGELLRTFPHPSTVAQVAFDAAGEKLATAAWDGKLRVFECDSGKLERELQIQKDRLSAMKLSPDGRFLVVGGREGKAQVYTFPELDAVGPPLLHLGAITSVAFSPDGQTIVTGGRDDAVGVWETATGRALAPPLRFTSLIAAVDVSSDGRRILVGTGNGDTHVCELPAARQRGKVLEHRFAIESLAFTDQGDTLAVGCANGVYLWDPAAATRRHFLSADRMRLRCVDAIPGRPSVFAVNWDNSLWMWTPADDKVPPPTVVPLGELANVLAVAESGRVWLAKNDRRTRLSSVDQHGKPGVDWPHPTAIFALAVSADETLVASGGGDFQVRLWDTATGQARLLLPHPDRITSLKFSRDGKWLASGCRDGSARIWEVSSGKLQSATAPRHSPVLSVAFRGDGQMFATGGGDRSACFWDPLTGIQLGAPLWHADAVPTVTFSPSGEHLATGCRDGGVRLWLPPANPSAGTVAEIRTRFERLTGLRLLEDGTFQRVKS